MTHGFLKKTSAIPREQIDFAVRCMNDWNYRQMKGEFLMSRRSIRFDDYLKEQLKDLKRKALYRL